MDDDAHNLAVWLMSGTGDLGLPRFPRWTLRAGCLSADPEAFYPPKGQSAEPAKRICRQCEVRDECRDFILELEGDLPANMRGGVWAGMTGPERAATTASKAAA